MTPAMTPATKRPPTLVGRMALVQLAVVLGVLAAMVGLSFVVVTYVLARNWDQGLLALCDVGVKRANRMLEKSSPDKPRGPKWVMDEMEEHRPIGVRIELQDANGTLVVSDGKGPRLVAQGPGCRNQGEYRVCERHAAGLHVLAGHSRAPGLADRNAFVLASAVVALLLGLLAAALVRRIAARGLVGLSQMADGIARITPGTGTRLEKVPAYQELALLGQSFNGLLARVEEALAHERRVAVQASHELRTPLTVLRGELEELVEKDGTVGAKRALGAADGLIRLVEALLWLSRSQAPLAADARGVVNLADVVREQVAHTRALHGQRPIDVVAPDEVLVSGNEPLLGRAVGNLIDNACKYTPGGGAVHVSVTPAAEAGGAAQVTVTDEGPGIPADLHARIFEPFFRGGDARAKTDGVGLGRPLAHSVARAHGGELSLTPSERGARFVLSIPALDAGSA
ncbi:MAG TPA: HAMP domain-containing sensor histidine kinase [Polyangia bacterium]